MNNKNFFLSKFKYYRFFRIRREENGFSKYFMSNDYLVVYICKEEGICGVGGRSIVNDFFRDLNIWFGFVVFLEFFLD